MTCGFGVSVSPDPGQSRPRSTPHGRGPEGGDAYVTRRYERMAPATTERTAGQASRAEATTTPTWSVSSRKPSWPDDDWTTANGRPPGRTRTSSS